MTPKSPSSPQQRFELAGTRSTLVSTIWTALAQREDPHDARTGALEIRDLGNYYRTGQPPLHDWR